METLAQDLRYALRSLGKSPAFATVAIATLALGIGANTAIFSIVHGTLLRALPYNDAQRLVTFSSSVPDYRDIRESIRAFDNTALWASNQYTVPGKDNAEQVLGATVSPEFFPLLGGASLGRTFAADEDRALVAVISHDYWASHFSSDPAVLGKSLKLNDELYTIVGVMPPHFTYPSGQFKVWVPFESAMQKAPQQAQNRQLRIFRVVAHLAPGVSISQAQAELDSISSRLAKQYPATNEGVSYRIRSLQEAIVGELRPVLFALLGTVALILLIACVNVANLLLARTTSRLREVSLRAALGASTGRIIRQFLAESLLLSAFGSVLGVVLAYVGLRVLRSFNPGNLPRMESIGIDLNVLLFTASVAMATGILFGLAPAWQAGKVNLLNGLKDSARSSSSGTSGKRVREGLVVSEIAFSLVVLIAAGLLLKSFDRLLHVETGFLSQHLLSVPVLLANVEKSQRAEVLQQVMDRVGALPGIAAAGGGSGLPPISAQRGTRFEVQGADNSNPDQRFAYFLVITSDYFRALGTKMVQGRAFTQRDDPGGAKVVIVNRELAERLFPQQDPIGKQIRLINPDQSPEWRTIVGVVQKVRYSGLEDRSDAQIYTPFAQTPFLWTYLMVRTGVASPTIAQIRHAIESTNGAITAGQVQAMDELVSSSVAQPRFQAILVASFAGLGMTLAIIGIYGVVSYSVAQRTHEIGVRMAIGAQRFHVLRMVLNQGWRLALLGIVAGILGALLAGRVLASMLFETKTNDSATFVSVSMLLAAVALLASYIPARRATKVDPIVAVRYE